MTISMFDWQKAFRGKTINEKYNFLTATLTDVFHNFIACKIKQGDYKTPERMNSMVISSLKERKQLTKIFYFKTIYFIK